MDHSRTTQIIQQENLQALETLIASIVEPQSPTFNNNDAATDGTSDHNSNMAKPYLPLASRILNSSLGGSAQEKKSSVLLKKMERALVKANALEGTSSSISTSGQRQHVEQQGGVTQTMNQVKELYKTLWKLEGQELARNVLILMSHLAGSEVRDPSHSHGSTVNVAEGADVDVPSSSAANAAASATSPTEEPLMQETKAPTYQPQPSMYSTQHVQLAIREEETNLLRECIHALQTIDGELIRFYQPQPLLNNDPPNTVEHYEGIRIRPGLLPFHLPPDVKVQHKATRLLTSGSEDALRICAEAGYLYGQIQSYIQTTRTVQSQARVQVPVRGVGNSHTHDNVGGGIVPRALASALESELKSYRNLLCLLQTQLQETCAGIGTIENPLTIGRLLIQLRKPTSQLRSMALLIGGIHDKLKGGQLLTVLYLHGMHGNVLHAALVKKILDEASLPWYDLVYDWCMDGILSLSMSIGKSNSKPNSPGMETGGEFFIQEDCSVEDAIMWQSRYTLREEQIPFVPGIGGGGGGILTQDLAQKILVVGKGINFIRRCLQDSEWNLSMRGLLSSESQKEVEKLLVKDCIRDEECRRTMKRLLGFHVDGSTNTAKDIAGRGGTLMIRSTLEQTVDAAASQVHTHILSSLFNQHHLLQHLQGMKEILFLGQGDFVSALMNGLHAEFESLDGTDEIYMHSMMGILHDAIRSTNGKFLPSFVLERIHVSLLPTDDKREKLFWIDSGDENKRDGWDIFSLGYDVDAPLTAVVHKEAMQKYQLVFKLLFRLKRIEWMLNKTWKQSTVLNHALQHMTSKYGGSGSSINRNQAFFRMKLLLRRFSMTRQNLLHFVTNLQSYLMFEVLESGWKGLISRLKTAKTLDEVITSHNEYLDEIVIKSLLSETLQEQGETYKLGRQLRKVLTMAYKFCKSHERIFSEALKSIDTSTAKRRNAERRTLVGKWGFDSMDVDVEGSSKFFNLSDEVHLVEIETISHEFDSSLQDLLSMLNEKINSSIPSREDFSSPSKTPKAFIADRVLASNNDSLRFLMFRLDFSDYYSERGE